MRLHCKRINAKNSRSKRTGDPSYAGPLTGKSLEIKTYHIAESEIKDKIDPATYEEHVSMMESVIDIDAIHEELKSMRGE